MRRTAITCSLLAPVIALSFWSGASAATVVKARPQTNPPSIGALPVISCPTTYGSQQNGEPFVAQELPTTSSSRGLDYYSNGLLTVLGPAGWACGALVAGDGGEKLDVYPPGSPNYANVFAPQGSDLVEIQGEYTGHLPGAEVVCGVFPSSQAATELQHAGQPCPTTTGQKMVKVTPDVVVFSDPPHYPGSVTGSGGPFASYGAAVYPQLPNGASDSVNVYLLSCSLPKKYAALCKSITGDFLVRNPPTYTPQATG